MNGQRVFPGYITRPEQLQIQREVDAVKRDGRSRTVLLYGPGGVGKTSLVRHMAESNSDPDTIWLDPIDVDDPECWLLSNLERKVAAQLDPHNEYFALYQQKLLQMPDDSRSDISHETVVSYLGRVKEVFARCYSDYADKERKTIVITFDTVETIRGTNLLLTLTQWMKALPTATLFILAGRPVTAALGIAEPGAGEATTASDPIEAELASPYHGFPVARVTVAGLSLAGAARFIEDSGIASALMRGEKDKLVRLTRGHPLWLAFLIDYLRKQGMPQEAEMHSLVFLEENLPYGAAMTAEGRKLHEDFLRRLVAPYEEPDYWHETFKRLAVVRQPIARPVWHHLMSDWALPADIADHDEAWARLLATPWARPRGGGRYVTLHDAMAEAFAERLFPLYDASGAWRLAIWQKAHDIYDTLLATAEADLAPDLRALDEDLKPFDISAPQADAVPEIPAELIVRSMDADARRRELDQWRAASLYYLFLCDFEAGCLELLRRFRQAESEHDTFLQDLLVLYLQRFLPGGTPSGAFNDVVRRKLEDFRSWLTQAKPAYYINIGLMVANYLIDTAQPLAAKKMLDELPAADADDHQYHRIHILRGDAFMRIPGRVREALPEFDKALATAELLDSPDRHKLLAEARKEQGYYYRNIGLWEDADLSYRHARDAMAALPLADRSAEDREEIASIHTNWAYVKGLTGSYREGLELVESAIAVRHHLGNPADEGLSWSVCGEIYRYAGRYEKAWAAYSEAIKLLQGRRNWGRLGWVRQEQAICLVQALEEGVTLTRDPPGDARKLITTALDICVSHNVRGYPSALNRAGRIFGASDPRAGLDYLRAGIVEAQRVSDGWFWFANVIEYAELLFRLWAADQNDDHRAELTGLAADVRRLDEEYWFPDLSGRWSLLQAHLAFSDYLRTRDQQRLVSALDGYQTGFANMAKGHVGSSGAAEIGSEFSAFRANFVQLPAEVQREWQARLRSAWAPLDTGSTLLLARLEELY